MTLRFWFRHVVRVIAAFVLWYVSPTPALCQSAPHVVISEIYGGGGNSGALYTHDFIEIHNPTGSDVVMNDWSVQYQGGGGTGVFTSVAGFSGIIRSHGFFLIQANPGSGGTVPLPSPDAVAGISMAAGSGKIALCSDAIGIGSPLDPGVVDFVGYGPANLFEGPGPAAAPGNTTSVERKATAGSDAGSMSAGGAEEHSGNGRDSDDNGADFIRRDPGPQNDASGTEIPGGNLNVMAVYEGKWNLVSLPLAVADPAASTVFPGALTPLFGYRGGYVGETTAVPGAGYWVRFGEPETVTFAGQATDPDTIVLDAGWNLVGSIAAPVAVGGLGQIPDNHIAGALFEYDGGYRQADTIRPGEAYWVRSTTGGSLVLGSGPSAAGSAAYSPSVVGSYSTETMV